MRRTDRAPVFAGLRRLAGRALAAQAAASAGLAAAALLAIPVLILADIAGGALGPGPVPAAIELVEYAVLLATVVACPAITRHRRHIANAPPDAGDGGAGGLGGRLAAALRGAVCVGVCLVLAVAAAAALADAAARGATFHKGLQVPEAWVWAVVAWAFAATALELLRPAPPPGRAAAA